MNLKDLDEILTLGQKQHELLGRTTPLAEDETLLIVRKGNGWKWRDQTHVTMPGLGKGRIQTDIIPGGGTGCLAWFTYAQIQNARDALAKEIAALWESAEVVTL